jgi:hypothetical protein
VLRSIKALTGYTLQTKDDQIGKVTDFYFDDQEWIVRYLVVDTGVWLPERTVLISRLALGQPDREAPLIPVELSKQQVENSPDIALAKPVSHQQEIELHKHYQWPVYWLMPGGFYHHGVPVTAITESMLEDESKTGAAPAAGEDNPHLRSVGEVCGYRIQARDGEIGCVEDFIVDDDVWRICYIVIKTRHWWRGKDVLIAPMWIEEINWSLNQVQVNLKRETIKNNPKFDPKTPLDQAYEAQLDNYYNQPDRARERNNPKSNNS